MKASRPGSTCWLCRLGTLVAVGIGILMASGPTNGVQAQTAPAIGTQVVIKGGASLKVGELVVDTGQSHSIYKVERADGDWLWLVSGKVAGWARSSDVIPFDQAIDYFSAEIKREPHAAWPYYNRGLIYQDRRNADQALSDYSAAVRQDPKFVPALINRGNIWLFKGSIDRAIDDYAEAIKNDPKAILAHVNRGIAWQTKGDLDKALTDYDEAIRLGLKSASAFNNRGHVREMKKDHNGAIDDATEAIRIDPGYALAWLNRGIARQSNKEYEQAKNDFTEYTRLAPKSPWGYARLAWLLATCPVEERRDGKTAVELASQACDLESPTTAFTLDARAAAHAESGDFAKAVFWETKAIAAVSRLNSHDADVYRGRLKLYQEKKAYRDN